MAKKEEWKARVAAWRESGQSATVFARGRPFTPGTLQWWASRLKRTEVAPSTAGGPSFVQVTRAERATDAAVVVTIGGARIEVRSGADKELLRTLLSAFGEAR